MPSEELSKLKPVIKGHEAILDSQASAAVLTKFRKKNRIQQKSLAIEMGISQMYLCDLEHGNRQWNLELFERAKAALGRLE